MEAKQVEDFVRLLVGEIEHLRGAMLQEQEPDHDAADAQQARLPDEPQAREIRHGDAPITFEPRTQMLEMTSRSVPSVLIGLYRRARPAIVGFSRPSTHQARPSMALTPHTATRVPQHT